MGAYRFNVAEQEWRESWEPTFPLVAPKLAVGTGELDDAWTQAERHLEYMVRLVDWAINARPGGVASADAELHAAIETVEQLVLQVTRLIPLGPRRE
jgi:hypothetical protein